MEALAGPYPLRCALHRLVALAPDARPGLGDADHDGAFADDADSGAADLGSGAFGIPNVSSFRQLNLSEIVTPPDVSACLVSRYGGC